MCVGGDVIMRTSYLFAEKQNITANKKRVGNFRFNFPFVDDMVVEREATLPSIGITKQLITTSIITMDGGGGS